MATVRAGAAVAGDPAGHACSHGEGCATAATTSGMKTEAEVGEETLQWGDFLASGDQTPLDGGHRDGAKEASGGVRLRSYDWSSADSWRAFSDEEDGTSHGPSVRGDYGDPVRSGQETDRSQGEGPWWLDSIREDERLEMSESASSHSNVEGLFLKCFPGPSLADSRTCPSEEVQTLEKLLSTVAGNPENQGHTRQAVHLWQSLWISRSTLTLGYGWPGSQFLQVYLTSLDIDPTDTVHPVHASPTVDLPITGKKGKDPNVLSTVSRCEQELKLSKGAGIFVHMNGFSPSQHLQALFQQWTQSSGKKKLKLAYEFNRSLLV
ncbi:uncharacterized protein LOC115073425 [Rhinatrema bivittatum]|uniref:uncharacterized protein LOC115073425 n=1 Tax=Rhinatrema bivittatum TaxID=194408 RepID=UPI00112ABB9C|nr:uncharacterized protein LOC115073425 [Rhinatrema bivittatum]